MTLTEDVRAKLDKHLAGFPGSLWDCIEYYADENVTGTRRLSFIDAAMEELKDLITSGRLQYQDGYRAGKAEGYAEAKAETVEFAGKILTAAQQANQDQREVVARSQGFQEGVMAMQEAVKGIQLYDGKLNDVICTSIDQCADQILNPQEENHD